MSRTAEPSADQRPDWASVAGDVLCPMCEYNLRGLAEPRCPECGYRFAWPELLDADRRLHRYLFEHQARQRPLWSFCKTAIGGLRPSRFWKTLTPVQPSDPKRLVVYWLVATFVGLFGTLSFWFQQSVDRTLGTNVTRAATWSPMFAPTTLQFSGPRLRWSLQLMSDEAILELDYVRFWVRSDQFVFTMIGWIVLWPLATIATLMIFRFSMRAARIRGIHAVRCVLYASDVSLWLAPACFVILGVYAICAAMSPPRHLWLAAIEICLLLAWEIVFTYRLIVAYRSYLRFDHPAATILATQLILWMALACGVLIFG